VVLSTRPATVKRIVDVDLPRPRDLKMLSSRRFGEIHGDLLEGLLEEATKAFSEGVREAADMMEAFGRAARERRGGPG